MKQTQLLLSLNRLCCSSLSPFRHVSRSAFGLTYSTAAAAATTTTTTTTTRKSKKAPRDSLYRRLSHLGSPDVSVLPVLDKWVDDKKSVNESNIRFAIRELCHHRRFTHAFEVSKWMSEKRSSLASAKDIATHLDLIAKVHGVEEAQKYFNTISEELRTQEVYGALLECFAHAKCIDKAEGFMQTMKDLGFLRYTRSYNAMLKLYWQTGNREKLDAMLNEMEAIKLKFDTFTYSILLNAFGGDGDIDGVERIVTKMESDPEVHVEWKTYAIAAKHFLEAQLLDKALDSLIKSEKLVGDSKRKNEAYSFIASLYANAGKKDEVLRVWELCKLRSVVNRDYISVLPSILKSGDIETAEMIFYEWHNGKALNEIRIPNYLISAYCEKGMVEKAKALLETLNSKRQLKPDSLTWYWMSYGYVKSNQMAKAVEAMESALSEINPQVYWQAQQETLAACIKYLKDEGDLERLNAMIESLKDKCAISAKIHENLIDYVSGRCDIEDVFEESEME